jgi:uncharacterized membrane protein
MNNKTQDQPASLADIAKSFVSPWVWISIFMVAVLAYKSWRAELAGLAALTPGWFVPIGAIVAAIGLLVLAVTVSRGEHVFFRITFTAFAAFIPAVLFVMLGTTGETLPEFGKTLLGILFLAGPWASVITAQLDNQAPAHAA